MIIPEHLQTVEQKAILETIHDEGTNLRYIVEAGPGTGKTTIILALIESLREQGLISFANKFTILVYNTELKNETNKKLEDAGLKDVAECRTLHSFAYAGVCKRYNLKTLKVADSKNESAEITNIITEVWHRMFSHVKYISTYRVSQLIKQFWKSDYATVEEFAYSILTDERQLKLNHITANAELMMQLTVASVREMERINFWTHARYLREYSVVLKDTPYCEYCAVDEAQDINKLTAMFLRRIRYKKLYLVGDKNQRIYQFLETVDMMSELESTSKVLPLTVSFRLNIYTCTICNRLLGLKDRKYIEGCEQSIKPGHSITTFPENKTTVVLFRTTNCMISYAIDRIRQNSDINLRFLGSSFKSFKSLMRGTLPWLAAMLESSGHIGIKNRFLKAFKDDYTNDKSISYLIKEFNDEAKSNNKSLFQYILDMKLEENDKDVELEIYKCAQLYRLLTKNDSCPIMMIESLQHLKNIMSKKSKTTKDDIVLSTAHAAKGLEFDYVILADDIWRLEKEEDLNIVYVAVSRARIFCDIRTIESKLKYYENIRDMYGWRTTEKGLTKALALKLLFDTKPELESLASLSLDEINEKFIEAPDSKQALQDALSKYGYTYVIGIDGGEIVSIAQEEEKDEYYTDGFEEDDEFDTSVASHNLTLLKEFIA